MKTTTKSSKRIFVMIPAVFVFLISYSAWANGKISLLDVTPVVSDYAINIVKPILENSEKEDLLPTLIKVTTILNDPETGINQNTISPVTYMVYDKLDKIKLGFLATLSLSPEQRKILKDRHTAFMQKNPADVFFAPSADELIRTKAAFGCSHYARAFIAVVKALNLIDNPQNMRYAISCKADDYNKAFKQKDRKKTINGHQFVLIKIEQNWIAINTSKNDWVEMPKEFLPDLLSHDKNFTIHFKAYPDATFLLRKIGKDYNDDCRDNSLTALMNIYRSGNAKDSDFRWSDAI